MLKQSIIAMAVMVAVLAAADASLAAALQAATTKARVYLGRDDIFIISNSGTTLYGGPGNDTVIISDGTQGVTLDQNVEVLNVSGSSNSYAFKQTGNKINIYDAGGVTLLVSVPLQSGGTRLSFSNGMASAILSGGVMTLGGATVSPTAPATVNPVITAVAPPTATATAARVYLGSDDLFTVSSSGTTLYGGPGNDVVTVASGVSGVTLDQNVERVNFSNAAASYAFRQTGNIVNVYDATGTTLLVGIPVQGGAGTLLSFSDGSAAAVLTQGVMAVGGATVSTGAARTLSPTLIPPPVPPPVDSRTALFSYPPAAGGGLIPSAEVLPGGSDMDVFVYKDFTLAATAAISEIDWRGGYLQNAPFGKASDFSVTIFESLAGGSQPSVKQPDGTEKYLVKYRVGGNAGETVAGTFGGSTMYDYKFVLPVPFQATGGTKYWLRIEAAQSTQPDWGLAVGTGGNGKFYQYSRGVNIFSMASGGDPAFSLR